MFMVSWSRQTDSVSVVGLLLRDQRLRRQCRAGFVHCLPSSLGLHVLEEWRCAHDDGNSRPDGCRKGYREMEVERSTGEVQSI